MSNNEGIPLHSDRSAWNTTDHDGEHARDIDESALLRHLPEPGANLGLVQSNGTNWIRVEENSLASYILHSLATAANDFIVASGAGVFVKKTLAEVGAILEADLDHGNLQGLGDGSDHSFIDQDVTAGSSPNFDGANFTGVSTAPEYSDVSGNDAGTDVSAAELEELTDASETTLHSHAADADTIHDNVAGEINAIATKATPVDADVVLIEDSADGYSKKKVLKSTLGGGGGAGASVGGAFDAEWKIDGILAVVTEVGGAFIVPDGATIDKVLVYAKDPGSAGSTIIDVNINGTTAYSTQGNRPTLAYDDADSVIVATDPDVVDVVEGDIITIDIDQVATLVSGLSVTILLLGTETVDYSYISASDVDTGVTGAELEELSDGSETTLHTHAGGGGGGADLLEVQVFS